MLESFCFCFCILIIIFENVIGGIRICSLEVLTLLHLLCSSYCPFLSDSLVGFTKSLIYLSLKWTINGG